MPTLNQLAQSLHWAFVHLPVSNSRKVIPNVIKRTIGNPAKVVKTRFDKEAIELLLNLSWWDWDIALIEKAMPILVKGDTSTLREFARQNGVKC